MRNFITITPAEVELKLAENLHSREMELMSYDFERDNHEQAIANLSHLEWDETTTPYKGLARDVMIARAIGAGLDSETIKKISDLNTLENHKLNLEAVKVETAKSERHYDALLTALPEGETREAALAAFAIKKAADEAKQK